MTSRLGIAVAICLCMAGGATAQVVRFETTMGDFDMVLNPTHNPVLQGHVDNMLDYVNRESYTGSWINRAASGFVLQMGGFYSLTKQPSLTIDSVRSIRPFNTVQGEPAAQNPGLSNTVGTVSLALSNLPGVPPTGGGTDRNSGTTSFFVNLTDNGGLDKDFTVFAAIPDMTVINNIMALTTIDRTQDAQFGGTSGNLALTDVPIQADGDQVMIKRAFIVTDAMTTTNDMAKVEPAMAQSAESFVNPSSAPILTAADAVSPAPALLPAVVPEPTSLLLAVVGLSSLGLFASRRRRR